MPENAKKASRWSPALARAPAGAVRRGKGGGVDGVARAKLQRWRIEVAVVYAGVLGKWLLQCARKTEEDHRRVA